MNETDIDQIVVNNFGAVVSALHREVMRELSDVMQNRESVDCDSSVTDLIALARALYTVMA